METLAIILGCLFIGLFIMTKLAERFSRPLEPGEGQKLSKILIIALIVLILARTIDFLING